MDRPHECKSGAAINAAYILGAMAILATVATLADDNADPREIGEWLDACVLVHVEQGVPYDEAARVCRSHLEKRASRA